MNIFLCGTHNGHHNTEKQITQTLLLTPEANPEKTASIGKNTEKIRGPQQLHHLN